MESTWENRDLPVLKATVEIFDRDGNVRATDIERELGWDEETVQRALRALYRKPFFAGDEDDGLSGPIIFVGAPTGKALEVAGQWPTPENLLERLVAALAAAGENDNVPEQERGKAKQAALWLGDTLSKIAIGALGGAGGHVLYS